MKNSYKYLSRIPFADEIKREREEKNDRLALYSLLVIAVLFVAFLIVQ